MLKFFQLWSLTILHFFEHFLPFWYYNILYLILYSSCPRSRISHFPKDFWLLLLWNGIRNPDLGTEWDYAVLISSKADSYAL